jgi:hypothetical protein
VSHRRPAHRPLGPRRVSFLGRRARAYPARVPLLPALVRLLGQRLGPAVRSTATQYPAAHRGRLRRARLPRARLRRARLRRARLRRARLRRARLRRARLRRLGHRSPVPPRRVRSRAGRHVRQQAPSTPGHRVPSSVVHRQVRLRVRVLPGRVAPVTAHRPRGRSGPGQAARRPRVLSAHDRVRPVAFRAPCPDRGVAPVAHRAPATTRSRPRRGWARAVARVPARTPPVRVVPVRRPGVRPVVHRVAHVRVGCQACRVPTRR